MKINYWLKLVDQELHLSLTDEAPWTKLDSEDKGNNTWQYLGGELVYEPGTELHFHMHKRRKTDTDDGYGGFRFTNSEGNGIWSADSDEAMKQCRVHYFNHQINVHLPEVAARGEIIFTFTDGKGYHGIYDPQIRTAPGTGGGGTGNK